jgi:dTDP-4-amino-4,6-dideoxygalactose transaminase
MLEGVVNLMIPFNKSPITNNSIKYIEDALNKKTSGDGQYTKKCRRVCSVQLCASA